MAFGARALAAVVTAVASAALASACRDGVGVVDWALKPNQVALSVDNSQGGRGAAWLEGYVTPNQSLTDSAGLAGLEVKVYGVGPVYTFTAPDFMEARDYDVRFDVPPDGQISVHLRLSQNGREVAGGTARWMLEPQRSWRATISRVPAEGAHHEFPSLRDSVGALTCYDNCSYKWRFPISDEAANYLDEGLWLRVYRQGD